MFEHQTSLGRKLISHFGKDRVHTVQYLNEQQQRTPLLNYHHPKAYQKILNVLKEIPRNEKIIVVGHSLGVTMSLATFESFPASWSQISHFINIAGAIRGLEACLWSTWPTCAPKNVYSSDIFGLSPNGNRWTSATHSQSMRFIPQKRKATLFLTVTIGKDDEIICRPYFSSQNCLQSSSFAISPNSQELNLSEAGLNHFDLPHDPEVFEFLLKNLSPAPRN